MRIRSACVLLGNAGPPAKTTRFKQVRRETAARLDAAAETAQAYTAVPNNVVRATTDAMVTDARQDVRQTWNPGLEVVSGRHGAVSVLWTPRATAEPCLA